MELQFDLWLRLARTDRIALTKLLLASGFSGGFLFVFDETTIEGLHRVTPKCAILSARKPAADSTCSSLGDSVGCCTPLTVVSGWMWLLLQDGGKAGLVCRVGLEQENVPVSLGCRSETLLRGRLIERFP
jgi:hypothetical protein